MIKQVLKNLDDPSLKSNNYTLRIYQIIKAKIDNVKNSMAYAPKIMDQETYQLLLKYLLTLLFIISRPVRRKIDGDGLNF